MEQISAQKYVYVIFSAGEFGARIPPFRHRFFTYQQAEKSQPNSGPGQHHPGPDFDKLKTPILSHFHNTYISSTTWSEKYKTLIDCTISTFKLRH